MTADRIAAVVTDLDGTFWGHDMRVHPATHAVVDALDAAGTPLLIATGRRAQGTLAGLTPAGLSDRPCVLMNGAIARDRADGPSFLVEAIDTPFIAEILDAFDRSGLEPLVYVDDPHSDMVAGPSAAAGEGYLGEAVGCRKVDDLAATIAEETVIGFGAFGYPRELLEPLADEINDRGLATAILARAIIEDGHAIMLQAAGIDKWTAIRAWCDRRGIDAAELAVVGDGGNDVLMLENAKLAIVPNNADPDIVALADHLIEPNEAGGWMAMPEILGL